MYMYPPSSEDEEEMSMHPEMQPRSPMNSDMLNGRVSIDLLLNPILNNTPLSPHGASQVALPSIEFLDLKPRPRSHTETYNQHQSHPSRHYQHRHQPVHHSSHGSQSSRNTSYASSRSASPPSSAHSNVPYTLEQVHYIQYKREDKKTQWSSIVQPFMRQFPNVVFKQSHGPKRGKGALECRYYRAQLYPQLDKDGNIVRDQNGEVVMINIRVRDRPMHHRNIMEDYVKLVTRCPEKVLEYSWTDEEDKMKARKILDMRAKRGIGPLPGAILRVRTNP